MHTGAVIAGRFVLERLAGTGGMGSVFRARDAETDEPVAIKLVRGRTGEHAERFEREAEVLAGLEHPGIVRYVAHGVTGRDLYLAMEWLDGEDLAARLERGPLSVAETVTLAARASLALDAAHSHGVIHRDVKPGNLFLVDGDLALVKVLDFGVARLGHARRSMTLDGAMLGTPGYMAPEQCRGDSTVDARADVFALGCVLFECLTGRHAFVGDQPLALLAKILLAETPRVSELVEVPAALDDLVARMMAKDPAARPDGATAVALAVAGMAMYGGATIRPPIGPAALTTGEQRLLCVVLVRPRAASAPAIATVEATADVEAELEAEAERIVADGEARPEIEFGKTLTVEPHRGTLEELAATLRPFDAAVERLADGSIVATLMSTGVATDQAVRAARCALAMRLVLPEARLALATGRGVVADRWPIGDVIDRAARLLRRSSDDGEIPVDDVTAGLLDARFVIVGHAGGLALGGEREVIDVTRRLLGKPTSCVGRDRELELLASRFAECVTERTAQVLLVTGPTGVGKSRVRYEFLQRLARSGEPHEVWMGRGDPISAGSPFGLLAQAIRSAAGVLDGEPRAVRWQKLHARVSRHVAAEERDRVAQFLGELVGTPSLGGDGDRLLRAARRDAVVMGDQMRRAWEDWVLAETAAQPVVLVLEDLHWGDLPTVRFVEAALRQAADRPLMVLALARPEVHELFNNLWEERGLREVRLDELGRRASLRLAREVLGDEVPAATVERVVTQAGGNAFYLEELIRAVAEGKGEALPETLLAMVAARLEALDPDARQLLRAASIFGELFWRGGMQALLGGWSADRVDGWIFYLVEREVIARRGQGKFPGETQLQFRHALVREAAYNMLTDADRALGHLLAGEWLEAAGESDAAVLAEHYERGADAGRAVGWYRRAAEQAIEGNDYQTALARAERGVVNVARLGSAARPMLGALRWIQAESHWWRGDLEDAQRCGREALDCLERGDTMWCRATWVVLAAAAHRGRLSDVGERGLLDELRDLEVAHEDASAFVLTAVVASALLILSGLYDRSRPFLARVEEVGRPLIDGDASIRGWMRYAQLYPARFIDGGPFQYVQLAQAALECFEQAGDLRTRCLVGCDLMKGYLALGAWEEVERLGRLRIAEAERYGMAQVAAMARMYLGVSVVHQGRHEEAAALLEAVVATGRAQQNQILEGMARYHAATLRAFAGDLGGAEREASQASRILRVTPPLRAPALALVAQLALAQERPEAALAAATEAVGIVDGLGSIGFDEGLVRLAHAEALHASGDVEVAVRVISAARARLLTRAIRVEDPWSRRSYLERVPEHARILALSGEWRR